MKVNFLIIGAQKCGTTTLFNILDSHPNIVGCNTKEPNFFNRKSNSHSNIDKYHDLFNQQEGVLYFEASTSYTFYPRGDLNIWDKIYEYNPDMKFIYLVRNPVDRIVSAYMHSYKRGYTDNDIERHIRKSPVIDVSRYATQITPYIQKFGENNVLVLDFEDLVQDTNSLVNQVSEFLNIDHELFKNDIFNIHKNKSVGTVKKDYKYDSPSLFLKIIRRIFPALWEKISSNQERVFSEKPTLSNDYKKMILTLLQLEIKELENLLGKSLSKWDPDKLYLD